MVEIYGNGVQIVVSECFGSAVEKIINEVPQFPYLVTVTGTNPIKMDKTWQEIREAFAIKKVVVSDDSLISMASFLADVITVEGSGDVSGYSVTVAKNGKLLQFLASSASDKPEHSKLSSYRHICYNNHILKQFERRGRNGHPSPIVEMQIANCLRSS